MWELLNNNLVIAGFFLLFVVPLYAKLGILDVMWKKNGKNGNGIKKQLDVIETNHLHTIEELIRDGNKEMREFRAEMQRVLFLVEELHKRK